MRDIDQAYREGMLAEYKALRGAGRSEEADHVAAALKSTYGVDVEGPHKAPEPEKKTAEASAAPERADAERPPEDTAEPKPQRAPRTPGRKPGSADSK
jgi:hypothetical protein